MDEIGLKIVEIIAKSLIVDKSKVMPKASIANDLNADSLDIINLVSNIEQEFDINFSDDNLGQIKLVEDIISKVKELEKNNLVFSTQKELKPGNETYIYQTLITIGDTNAEGNVYFNAIGDLMGKARDYFALAIIPNYQKNIGVDYFLITAETHCYYKNNLYFGDKIIIEISIDKILPASVIMNFEIYREKELCVAGKHKILFADSKKKVQKFSEDMKTLLYRYYRD